MTARRDDEGTVLLLTVGLSVVLLLLVAVVVDVTKVILAKRAVASAADGAAIAAAQQVDVAAVRASLSGTLPLDPAAVAEAVAAYAADADDEQPGLRLAGRVDPADRGLAVVEARRSVTLPFVGWLGVAQVQVAAVARARSPLAP